MEPRVAQKPHILYSLSIFVNAYANINNLGRFRKSLTDTAHPKKWRKKTSGFTQRNNKHLLTFKVSKKQFAKLILKQYIEAVRIANFGRLKICLFKVDQLLVYKKILYFLAKEILPKRQI